MLEVWPRMHPKFSFRRMGVRWLIQLLTSFQECNETQHIKWKMDPLTKSQKNIIIKSSNANQVLKNCAIKSGSVNYFGAEKPRYLDTIL